VREIERCVLLMKSAASSGLPSGMMLVCVFMFG
jgi:hypothetical protein